MIQRALTLLLILTACSCSKPVDNELAELAWILGDWTSRDGTITESWRSVSNHTFEGAGETHNDGKVSRESMRLVLMSDEISFIAKVAHNERPVAFQLSRDSTPSRAIFVNAQHDFPKQIVYRQDGPDLVVEVSDGASQGFEIHFSRRGSGGR
ncbi:MAG: DUF6265 family protein [Gammaproteobacteria bacterium]|nr:DUF6265 family protein [Gammaproteobacteria bacterium]